MWLPPMWTVRSGLRACRSNSRGAFATCSRIQSGSSLTSWPSTFWPAASSRRSSARAARREVDAELADDAPPAALELLHRRLVEDLVARHLVDQHGSLLPVVVRGHVPSPVSPVSRISSGRPSFAAARSACARSSARRLLREPDDPLVVAEVVVAQLRVAVEPEPAPDDAVEAAHEEVGEEVRPRLVLRRRRPRSSAAPGEPRQVVERAARAAVGVATTTSSPSPPRRPRRGSARAGCAAPAAAAAPRGPSRAASRSASTWSASAPHATTTVRHPGNASWSMNRSLKSVRPGELDVLDLVEHRVRGGALGHRERGDLRALAGDVPGRRRCARAAASARARSSPRSPR